MPLSIFVAPGLPVPIYQQIVDQVRAAVVSGRMAEGDALPPSRALAEELRVNANTVAKAYAELQREGIIESHGTRGMFVAPPRQLYTKSERRRRIEPALKAILSEALYLGYTHEEIVAEVEETLKELSPRRPRGGSK